MADLALVTGISGEKIIEIKETEILDTVKTSIKKWGWLPDLFRSIVGKAKGIKHLQDKILPGLKQQLADTKGMFKGKERKALTTKIEEAEQSLKQQFDQFPEILKAEGYPDVQAFMRIFRQMETVAEQYHHDLTQ